MSPGQAVVLALRFYKRRVSPLLPPACRFIPSCGEYAADAVELHGVWRGFGLGLKRLLRCHPWSAGGFDPVPGSAPAMDFAPHRCCVAGSPGGPTGAAAARRAFVPASARPALLHARPHEEETGSARGRGRPAGPLLRRDL